MKHRLKELVKIPSTTDDETRIADYLIRVTQELNCEIHRLENDIVIRVPGKNRRKAFILNGHTDTVPPQTLNGPSPYELRIDPNNEDRLIGLGASDMKASLAIMLDFIEQASSTKPPCDLLFLFSTREETTGSGSEHIVGWLIESSYLDQYDDVGGLILEPTDTEFIGVGHRGDTLWGVHAEGPGGHASQIFDNPPAIETVSRFVAALPSIRKEWSKKYSDTVLGAPSINVTSLQADGKSNVVPSSAGAALSLRATPQLRAHLDEARTHLANTYGVTITQSWTPNPTTSDPGTLIYKTMQSVAHDLPFKAFPGATDKYAFDRHKIPMLIYGPGSVAAMHQPEEWVEYHKMAICRSMIERAIAEYAIE